MNAGKSMAAVVTHNSQFSQESHNLERSMMQMDDVLRLLSCPVFHLRHNSFPPSSFPLIPEKQVHNVPGMKAEVELSEISEMVSVTPFVVDL